MGMKSIELVFIIALVCVCMRVRMFFLYIYSALDTEHLILHIRGPMRKMSFHSHCLVVIIISPP